MSSVFGLEYKPEHGPIEDEISEVGEDHAELDDASNMEDERIIAEMSQQPTAKEESKPLESQVETTSGNDGYFEGLIENYKTETLDNLEEGKARTDIIIRYYRHEPDGNSAYALEELGFYIHERPVNARFANFQSNAIYYGDSVEIADIQLVSYTLLKEGVPIKEIKPSKFGSSWKSKSIEIGTDTTLIGQPSLSAEYISTPAALIMAYSPDTLYAATGKSKLLFRSEMISR